MKVIEGWSEKKLSELAEYINGYSFKPDDWGEDGLPIIRIEQLKNPNELIDYSSGKIPQKNIIENGDLIFSWSASLFLRIWQHGRAALNQHLFKVIEKEGVDRVFLKLFIEFYLPELTKASHGSTMQHITRKELDRFRAPFPISKFEQTKIAEILSKVDQAIEQTEALIAKKQRIKTGLMQDLLTRGIDEHGNLRSEETHEFKDSPLGRIPVEWEVKPCAALCREIVVGIVIRPAQYYRPEGIPVLRSANVRENTIFCDDLVFISKTDNEMLSKSRLREGDLVTVRTGYPGTTSVIPRELDGSNCVDLVISRPKNEVIRSNFLSIWVNSDNGKRQVLEGQGGLAQQHFNVGEMRTLLVKVPDISEQEKIERILILQSSVLEDLTRTLQKLFSLKTALMQDLLTGKTRVTALFNQTEVADV
ncbi:restriction endonuclease subunit S [Methanosarcina mazei]|uniref:Type I restriction-modification system, specificity subunit S n=1 Tax=Methanosarcina mazei S-6 TaxID=213585 RepID=A0A0E3RLC4_METMZ|nr:restriction endonuclease subunit S [Methanosarcina mazei]AKB65693.1 Type I restriction-modification system, specificity subunit S [Methanosarcina mazei S-6]